MRKHRSNGSWWIFPILEAEQAAESQFTRAASSVPYCYLALVVRLLFTIPLITRGSFATNTTTVQDSDTFLGIAYSAGISVESLEAANPGVIATDLFVGQILTVPVNGQPATDTPASNAASSIATAPTLTTLATSASSPVSSNPLLSGSLSATLSVSPSASSTAASSSTPTGASSTTTSPTSTNVSSTVPSTSSSVASSTTSTTSSPSSTPPATSTSSPPPPSSAPPTSTTASSTPNSPPAPVSCRPSPTGSYHDATQVQQKTDGFCSANKNVLLTVIQSDNGILDGSSQGNNHNQGSTLDESGYNMTVTATPGCSIDNATVMYPLPTTPDFNCTTLLYNAWETCYSNDGMGGSITAGCLTYNFDPDP
ncbi:hypothetical protein HO173_003367 [Letharia columbiana]|uniref:LysM domain-containing protein n=1 Tax=Letharia columbiana TaxID=112416 RepID=A0A8H6G0T1_9LECA|nr:uncharacterized protein HO173_003367 [Letharia columbiana]KAF6238400.1 hypothetical protein HO173_003367 [Letharia columbiana]